MAPASQAGHFGRKRDIRAGYPYSWGMDMARLGFYIAIGIAALAFVAGGIRASRRIREKRRPSPTELGIGFGVCFFDTLGIGSFAPTTALCKFLRLVPDEHIPGTLNIGLTPAALLQAVLFVTAVLVDPLLLLAMVGSAAAGAWLGAGVVSRMARRPIQIGMGIALVIAGTIFVAVSLGLLPGGGTAMSLAGWRFGLAVGINFILGALMSVGIGCYAPCMITLALLGMHPIAAFPIMMGSCALLMPIAGLRFLESQRFGWGTSWGLAIGGIFGVLVAVYLVKSLPLETLRWLVTVVIAYAAFTMLRSAMRPSAAAALEA
jgi:uncharacterized membrane protein YfcA